MADLGHQLKLKLEDKMRRAKKEEIAISSLQVDAKPECIDNDWLEQFMDKARLVSYAEFKLI